MYEAKLVDWSCGGRVIAKRTFATIEEFSIAQFNDPACHAHANWECDEIGQCELCNHQYDKVDGVEFKHRKPFGTRGYCSQECLLEALEEMEQDRRDYVEGRYPYDGTFAD